MSKAKGTRIERKVIKLLERSGYEAHRTPASLGVWDVIAWLPNGPMRCIQVKGGKTPWCSPAERELMTEAPVPSGATRELWQWRDYERHPVITYLGLTPR